MQQQCSSSENVLETHPPLLLFGDLALRYPRRTTILVERPLRILLARAFARIESQEATMTAVDRLGFHVRLKTQDVMRGARIAFLREVSDPAETRNVLVEMVQQVRSKV